MKSVSQTSKDALAAHTQKRRQAVNSRIEKALKAMRRENAEITISSVARRAKVTRASIHRRPRLLALIRAHHPPAALDTTPKPAAADGDSSILASLRSRLIAKDAQIADLKAALRERD
jgi:hypothetical protein